MFDSIDDAINFGEQKQNDGGLPLFKWVSREVPHSDPVAYEDVVEVTIINKGDSTSIIVSNMREEYKTRWPAYWKAFMEGSDAPLEGISLKDFPAMTPADIATCQRYHIRTVEDLAVYPDGQLKNLGGRGTSLKRKAVQFLEYRQGPDVNELKQRIEELEKLVGDNNKSVSKRATGNRVSKSGYTGVKQQSRRKSNPADSKDSSETNE